MWLRTLVVTGLLTALLVIPGPAWGQGSSLQPPTTGPYAYYPPHGTFGPDQPGFLAVGESYVDPVFGSTIRRVSNVYPESGNALIYARNGYWNADGTRYLHAIPGGEKVIIDPTTGQTIRTGIPQGVDPSFDSVNPDILYHFSGASLMQYSVSSGLSTTVKTLSGTLGSLGGSVDWIDNSGRYMLLNIDGFLRVWDKQLDVLYSGSIPAGFGGGWGGIAPDASGVVTNADNDGRWYAIDHTAQSLSTTGFQFKSSGGDHGDIVSASDGKTYLVARTSNSENTLSGFDARTGAKRLLLTFSDAFGWCDYLHLSGISRGPMKDWMLVNTELASGGTCGSPDSTVNPNPTASWWPYRQEIFMVNVITGEIRRLAHHRSRELDAYCRQPRINVNWDGTKAMFASNYGVTSVGGSCGYSDIYSVNIPGDSLAPAAVTGVQVQ